MVFLLAVNQLWTAFHTQHMIPTLQTAAGLHRCPEIVHMCGMEAYSQNSFDLRWVEATVVEPWRQQGKGGLAVWVLS